MTTATESNTIPLRRTHSLYVNRDAEFVTIRFRDPDGTPEPIEVQAQLRDAPATLGGELLAECTIVAADDEGQTVTLPAADSADLPIRRCVLEVLALRATGGWQPVVIFDVDVYPEITQPGPTEGP